MLKMNLITRKEMYRGLCDEVYEELYRQYRDLCCKLHWELYWELGEELGLQIRIDFHNSKFRGYNTIC